MVITIPMRGIGSDHREKKNICGTIGYHATVNTYDNPHVNWPRVDRLKDQLKRLFSIISLRKVLRIYLFVHTHKYRILRSRLPFWICYGTERRRSSSEVRSIDPFVFIQIIPSDPSVVRWIGLLVEYLKWFPWIWCVAKVFIAGRTANARGQNRNPGGCAGWQSFRGETTEYPATRFLNRVQLTACYAVLLFEILTWVHRGRTSVPVVDHRCVQVNLGRNVNLDIKKFGEKPSWETWGGKTSWQDNYFWMLSFILNEGQRTEWSLREHTIAPSSFITTIRHSDPVSDKFNRNPIYLTVGFRKRSYFGSAKKKTNKQIAAIFVRIPAVADNFGRKIYAQYGD